MKKYLIMAGVALAAVAVAYRVPQIKDVVFDDGSFFG